MSLLPNPTADPATLSAWVHRWVPDDRAAAGADAVAVAAKHRIRGVGGKTVMRGNPRRAEGERVDRRAAGAARQIDQIALADRTAQLKLKAPRCRREPSLPAVVGAAAQVYSARADLDLHRARDTLDVGRAAAGGDGIGGADHRAGAGPLGALPVRSIRSFELAAIITVWVLPVRRQDRSWAAAEIVALPLVPATTSCRAGDTICWPVPEPAVIESLAPPQSIAAEEGRAGAAADHRRCRPAR